MQQKIPALLHYTVVIECLQAKIPHDIIRPGKTMYHGIIIDQEFKDKSFPKTFKVFAKKQAGSWRIYGIEIQDSEVEQAIQKIQNNMRTDEAWYAHLYNDKELIVIFKKEVFRVKPHVSTWKPIVEYGRKLNIPEEQLDFWPNRFQDERHYFEKNLGD